MRHVLAWLHLWDNRPKRVGNLPPPAPPIGQSIRYDTVIPIGSIAYAVPEKRIIGIMLYQKLGLLRQSVKSITYRIRILSRVLPFCKPLGVAV